MKKIFLLLLVFISLFSQAQNKYLIKVSGSGGTSTFQNNIIMNATTSNRLGYWVNGDTIPVAGLGLDAAFQVITQKAVPPTYVPPTATISSSPSSGTYEIGTNLGTITFSSTFTQNNGGALKPPPNGTIYYKGAVALASNTDIVSSLTSSLSYRVKKSYDTGACIANNLGVIDCTGRIVAGSVYSSYITFSPLSKRYWGYTSNASANNSDLIASLGGGQEFATSKDKYDFSVVVSGTNKHIFYAYPASFDTLTTIYIGGIESIRTFDRKIMSFTNAQGYPLNYYVYTSQNEFNNVTAQFTSVN
jgi:hypothetical protein